MKIRTIEVSSEDAIAVEQHPFEKGELVFRDVLPSDDKLLTMFLPLLSINKEVLDHMTGEKVIDADIVLVHAPPSRSGLFSSVVFCVSKRVVVVFSSIMYKVNRKELLVYAPGKASLDTMQVAFTAFSFIRFGNLLLACERPPDIPLRYDSMFKNPIATSRDYCFMGSEYLYEGANIVCDALDNVYLRNRKGQWKLINKLTSLVHFPKETIEEYNAFKSLNC